VQKVVDETMAKLGRIDILVNNAGATGVHPRRTTDRGVDKVMNLNIRSLFPVRAGRRQGQHDPQQARRIINVPASRDWRQHGCQVHRLWHEQGAAVNFTRHLAAEWGAYGITVNALAPGFFPSKMTKGVLAQFGSDKLAAAAPLKRIGDDDDLKVPCSCLPALRGTHITGQILAVDGGVSLYTAMTE
jgi:gluconate 5-dehydrogenase